MNLPLINDPYRRPNLYSIPYIESPKHHYDLDCCRANNIRYYFRNDNDKGMHLFNGCDQSFPIGEC